MIDTVPYIQLGTMLFQLVILAGLGLSFHNIRKTIRYQNQTIADLLKRIAALEQGTIGVPRPHVGPPFKMS